MNEYPPSLSSHLSLNLLGGPPCPSVSSSGLRPLPLPGQTESRRTVHSFPPTLPQGSRPWNGGLAEETGGGYRVSNDEKTPEPYGIRARVKIDLPLTLGKLRPRVVKGSPGVPSGACPGCGPAGRCPWPGDRAGGRAAGTSHGCLLAAVGTHGIFPPGNSWRGNNPS